MRKEDTTIKNEKRNNNGRKVKENKIQGRQKIEELYLEIC